MIPTPVPIGELLGLAAEAECDQLSQTGYRRPGLRFPRSS
jgi:hypothetical protein